MAPAFISFEALRGLLTAKGKYRARRHGLFWLAYGIYFYLQSISPDCVKGLQRREVFHYAFNSLCCFLPACVACVYTTLYLLDPLFLQKKRYWSFVLSALVLFGLSLLGNYFFSVLFFALSCHCNAADIPFIRKFSLGFLNSQNAIISGGLALGIKLAVRWFYQKKENLRLARLTTKTRLNALRAKVHPDYILQLLQDIREHIKAGDPDSRSMILKLSDLLTYCLYEGEEEHEPS